MKGTLRAFCGAAVLSLLFVAIAVAAGHTGVSGRLWDSGDPAQPWQHGALVVALRCTEAGAIHAANQVYGCGEADESSPNYGRFDYAWGPPASGECTSITVNTPAGPSSGDWVCLYIIWKDGGTGQPPDQLTEPQQWLDFVDLRMNFGNIQSGTGPTAITLSNVTAQSANLWLPVGLAVLSVLIVSALLITRRLRA